MIRLRRGTALLNSVVKTFETAVADLDTAIEQISEKRVKTLAKVHDADAKHEAKIARMNDDHTSKRGALFSQEDELWTAQTRATAVRANIAKLVNVA